MSHVLKGTRMNLKKQFIFLVTLLFILPMFWMSVSAQEEPIFYYELTVDGKDTVEVENGDLVTVTLYLYRTDLEKDYTMYAMQDEIRYDNTFLELVKDSPQLLDGVRTNDIGVTENRREFYMSYLSFNGGETWQYKTRVGSVQFKVIGTSGVTNITNEDFRVSLPDGSDSYKCDANVLKLILSTECTIKFETNGGTPIDPIVAIYGERIDRPEDPIREGKYFVGWFKDIHLTEEWDFETDTVTGNMTLYAKWEDENLVTPDTDEGSRCVICGREDLLVPNLSICWICLLILIALLIFAYRALSRRNKKKDKREQVEQKDSREVKNIQQKENDVK